MFKKPLLFLMLLVLHDCLSMETQDQAYQEDQPISPTLDGLPEEIQEMIFKEVLKQSIDELKIPISGNDSLEEPQNRELLLDFVQRYSYIMHNLRLINRKYNDLILNLQDYVNYLLVLKLGKLTADQKFNALLCFIKLRRSTFIIAALLSFNYSS